MTFASSPSRMSQIGVLQKEGSTRSMQSNVLRSPDSSGLNLLLPNYIASWLHGAGDTNFLPVGSWLHVINVRARHGLFGDFEVAWGESSGDTMMLATVATSDRRKALSGVALRHRFCRSPRRLHRRYICKITAFSHHDQHTFHICNDCCDYPFLARIRIQLSVVPYRVGFSYESRMVPYSYYRQTPMPGCRLNLPEIPTDRLVQDWAWAEVLYDDIFH
ncbi:hypothetical protein P153DRAFT_383954 [Dothidotthia symphoricarpi CBS 119687]|uniref:Uncharacterized protein n=1 Tax=Dothidotthia symphoricarpi CBS 119687 TaxID=1392245 RepID=A0A6A6AFP7_9PLEO|nr:uncharacterized protein P153DRAFT_383954 [Dothidotthia symphoricarpi CBS 119687]KAF2130729.1 hypothetical protein P153DRAFT_383954 [Dothidotthia symphoricarpi CBS 119687]